MKIGDTNIHADRFTKAASAVLLSHFHRDHLTGVGRYAGRAPLVCSPLTARLLDKIEHVDLDGVITMMPGEQVTLKDGRRRVRISAVEANHCPGALMFLVEWAGSRALYTGDFRLNDAIRSAASALRGVDLLYLDATYERPRYLFPPQQEAVERILSIMRRREKRRVYLAVYSLGKNRIIEAAFQEFGLPFYTTKEKRRIYEAIDMGHLVSDDREATPFRAYGRGYLEHYFKMSSEYRRGDCLAIIPSGWAVDRRSFGVFHYVPYSEHCDYRELQEFRRLVAAKHVVPIHGPTR